MSERGSSLLRLMQNQETPVLDLFVRESIQNSLDAAKDNSGFVDVQFRTGDFNSKFLCEHLEGIKSDFVTSYQDNAARFISISDKNTNGLTGPLHFSDVRNDNYGNLLKLVYEINMPQTQEGSGGSWGLGKTIYFRLGIGLVFYYSRIEVSPGIYQSRFAGCLVEDETSENAILIYPDEQLKRGIAWWGRQRNGDTEPITDEAEIEEILNIFSLKPYQGDETGTTIIIPYIDESQLLGGIIPEEEDDRSNLWLTSVERYLNLSVQRWYAPRLSNPNYKYGRWLRCSINGKGISEGDLMPLFKLIQDLYNSTKFTKHPVVPNTINLEDILLRNEFKGDSCAGQIAFVKADRALLKMPPPDNYPDPFQFINQFDTEGDFIPPIIAYTRKPGMIVNYETSGIWTDSIPKTPKDEFIIGLFVLNSMNEVKSTTTPMPLEEYIRKGEKADHTSWNDWIGNSKFAIVSKIARHVNSKIGKKYAIGEKTTLRKNIGLSKALAEILLPPENFGTRATPPTTPPSGGNGKKSKNLSFYLSEDPVFGYSNDSKTMKMKFVIDWTTKSSNFLLSLTVKTESNDVHAPEWESSDNISKPFPTSIAKININDIVINKKKMSTATGIQITPSSSYSGQNEVVIELSKTNIYNTYHSVEFLMPDSSNGKLEGEIELRIYDEYILPGLIITPLGGSVQ